MGGVAGHMDHLYDNPKLTFGKMKEIMAAASNGELQTEEKVDGQNLFLSYSVREGKAKAARNKGNLKQGGLDAAGLTNKFSGRGGLQKAFTGGFAAFEEAVESLSTSEKERIFGPDTNIWYNAEVMDPGTEGSNQDPGAVNVIKYDDKTIKIHNVGHFIFDRESGEKEAIPKGALETLDGALKRMQRTLHKNDYNLARRAIIQLQKIEDDSILKTFLGQLDTAIGSEGLGDKATVEEYMWERLINGMESELPIHLKKEITKYLLGAPGNIGLRALKKGLSSEDLEDLNSVIATKKMLLKEAIWPIELIVHDFTVEILKGLKSVFIADTSKEVMRLKEELAKAVRQLTAAGEEDPQSMAILQRQLNKIKDFSRITTPIEAIVFDYDGHTYKFAGNFAPLNQILGMFKYPKTPQQLTAENLTSGAEVLTEKEGKKVALLPGGFKPPHAGHYGLAKLLASQSDIDEVIVIIGKNPRLSDVEPKITVTAEQSKTLWDLYTRNDKNIKVRIQEGKTPVADVYDLIANKNSFSEGDTVVLGKSDKDVGDKRYGRAQSWAEMHNPGVNVEEMVFPVIGGKSMGGTALRDMIASDQKERFISKLPKHLNKSDLEGAWDIVSPLPVEGLNKFIDHTIEEISTMAAGSVQGSMGANGFGPPNTYNSYRRAKKPKVKRAKRQRRR